MKKVLLVVRIIVAVILLQTLYFKFTAHPESVHIFSTLGLEPYGRIGTGIVELIASILLFIPNTIWLGALSSLGIISGAIMGHLTTLGIEVNGDGGSLFALAVIVFIGSAIVLFFHRKEIPIIGDKL